MDMVDNNFKIILIIKVNSFIVKNMEKVDFVIMINIILIIWDNLNKIKYQDVEYHKASIIDMKENGWKVKWMAMALVGGMIKVYYYNLLS